MTYGNVSFSQHTAVRELLEKYKKFKVRDERVLNMFVHLHPQAKIRCSMIMHTGSTGHTAAAVKVGSGGGESRAGEQPKEAALQDRR